MFVAIIIVIVAFFPSLMTKFSKKLVSKCVYVLILKNTELPLLGAFMVEGGWNLVHVWLQDGYNNKNWALVSELLELLLMSPTTVEQLKTNNLPKLVKSLSKREDLEKVKELANQLVQKWLKIVKEDQNQNNQAQVPQQIVVNQDAVIVEKEDVRVAPKDEEKVEEETVENQQQACYKLAVRDGKHILCKVPPSEANVTVIENAIIEDITPGGEVVSEKVNEKEDDVEMEEKESVTSEMNDLDKKKEKSNHDRHKSKSSSSKSSSGSKSSSSSSSSSSRDKDRKSSSSRDKSKDKSRSSSSSSNKSKDRSSRDKSKDKHRSNGSLKSSSSKSSSRDKDNKDKNKKETKEKQAEKDKDTLTKIQPQTLQRIGRIPKKSSDEQKDETKESKKPSFSIEVRKNSEEKPKTVKVFNAKMRSTGLLEEAKPPPPRPIKKTPAQLPPSIPPAKRPSPIRDLILPPEKKLKVEPIERPGAIKLIPPKPKPPVLQESDIFMDALAASASAKKEPKKRKRRISISKESTASGSSSPPTSPQVTTALTNGSPSTTTTTTSTHQMALRGITPPNFYQDTLETENDEDKPNKDEDDQSPKMDEATDRPSTPTDTESKMDMDDVKPAGGGGGNENELKGVLVHVRKKGPKKSLKWKCEAELVEVQYFELDETERVNVSKPFGDMARMEITSEKHALQMRKVQNDDNMSPQIPWRLLREIDLKPILAEPGCKSLEKDIQFAREKSFIGMSPLMHRYADSPAEPDLQQYQVTDPVIIPLEDPENSDPDAPPQLWPEPKGSPPQVPIPNMPPMFPNIQAPFQNFGGPPPGFQNVPFNAPNFVPPPNMMGGPAGPNVVPPANPHDWNNMNNPMVNPMNNPMNNGPIMPPNCPPDMMNQGPPMFPPKHPDNFNQNMNEFPPQGFNQPNMFPQNNFNMRGSGGRGGFRGGRGANGPWVRMNGPGPGPGGGGGGGGGWNQRGGGMNRGGRVCKNVKNYGYCRNRDNCPFFHPN
ncbi:serine/threonine-protein phosphatase 1 regulatory subunit 10-related [Holotrichia oblita]|uniref:Serine/threonine-protein phosphatase 1 regulatory subunit 10-related n=1 Tax=Holotrichia oblita TaxID=644536 RepID=A0ACB9TBH6_HOLOL|nr:serine/threonine-protein phosphatase 1 regulatory subunit 10-related [Holotrichia oblita]